MKTILAAAPLHRGLAVAALALLCSAAPALAVTYNFDAGGAGSTATGTDLAMGTFNAAGVMTSSNTDQTFRATYTAMAEADYHVTGFWQFSTQDQNPDAPLSSANDPFGYFIGDMSWQLSSNDLTSPAFHNGVFDFIVMAGQSFGFYMENLGGNGAASVTIFANHEKLAPVPLPATGLLLGGALAGIGLMRRRMGRSPVRLTTA